MFYNKRIFERCFDYKGKYWYKNIKAIPLYFRLMHYLIKHGYDEYATWETFDWFIDTMKAILTDYRNNHQGYPVSSIVNDMLDEDSAAAYDKGLDKMIALLNDMDENSPKYETEEYDTNAPKKYDEIYAAKDEFFKLFAEYFYNLWD